jgi:hypothetical protein
MIVANITHEITCAPAVLLICFQMLACSLPSAWDSVFSVLLDASGDADTLNVTRSCDAHVITCFVFAIVVGWKVVP